TGGSLPEVAFAVAHPGDEFVVGLPGFARDAAPATAETIRTRVAHTIYLAAAGQTVSLTMSLGVATFPADADSAKELLAAADRALVSVKGTARHTVGRARA